MPNVDFHIRDEGPIVLLWPISQDAVEWCDEHLPEDCTRWLGATVIEHRYAHSIVEGLAADGLVGREVAVGCVCL